jgi:hypothetical protein
MAKLDALHATIPAACPHFPPRVTAATALGIKRFNKSATSGAVGCRLARILDVERKSRLTTSPPRLGTSLQRRTNMPERIAFRRRAVGALMFGLIGLIPLLARPTLHTLRAVVLISVYGCGMCIGVALTLFIFAFKAKEM